MADIGGPSGAAAAGFMPPRWHGARGRAQMAAQYFGSEHRWECQGRVLTPHLGVPCSSGLGVLCEGWLANGLG